VIASLLALLPGWLDPQTIIGKGGLWLVAAIIFAESGLLIGFFLPGDSLLFITGFLASKPEGLPHLNQPLWLILIVVYIAAVAGDQVGYIFGRAVGPSLFQRPKSRLFNPDNVTRFFVIGKKASGPVGGGRDLTSLVISLGDEAASHSGSLLKMLMPFGQRGINLSKVESRPSKRRPWDYLFFIDVTGHYEDAAMKEAIAELKKFCPLVKWLGSYPATTPVS